jgi:hypothetical protein
MDNESVAKEKKKLRTYLKSHACLVNLGFLVSSNKVQAGYLITLIFVLNAEKGRWHVARLITCKLLY